MERQQRSGGLAADAPTLIDGMFGLKVCCAFAFIYHVSFIICASTCCALLARMLGDVP